MRYSVFTWELFWSTVAFTVIGLAVGNIHSRVMEARLRRRLAGFDAHARPENVRLEVDGITYLLDDTLEVIERRDEYTKWCAYGPPHVRFSLDGPGYVLRFPTGLRINIPVDVDPETRLVRFQQPGEKPVTSWTV